MKPTGCAKHRRFCRAALEMWRLWLEAVRIDGPVYAGIAIDSSTGDLVQVCILPSDSKVMHDFNGHGSCSVAARLGMPDMGGE